MRYLKAIRASVVRFCYLIHGSVGVFLTVYLTQNSYYWFTAAALILCMIEIILTFKCNEGGEWRWFTPMILIYLSLVIPIVWVLEYTMLELRIEVMNRTQSDKCPVFLEQVLVNPCKEPSTIFCSILLQDIYNQKLRISTTYQQTLMLTLIVGRWVVPKGGLTQDELSQLLLVYVGIAADMLEFSSETMKLEDIACRREIFTVILCVWSWSTLQFSLCLTSKKRRRRIQVRELKFGKDTRLHSGMHKLKAYLCHAEIWALMTDVILQDAPYLVTRVYILCNFNAVNQSLIFFTCKNALLLMLQFYRLYVVINVNRRERKRGSSYRVTECGINGAEENVPKDGINCQIGVPKYKQDSAQSVQMAIYTISSKQALPLDGNVHGDR
ncbi:transmembrane protein 26-like [Amphiura filiformis]|uniref:transmembrane protein 26-like n=1 Tax=Amphiura filiformis TaxID=82378 RepID=UPI003B21CB63